MFSRQLVEDTMKGHKNAKEAQKKLQEYKQKIGWWFAEKNHYYWTSTSFNVDLFCFIQQKAKMVQTVFPQRDWQHIIIRPIFLFKSTWVQN